MLWRKIRQGKRKRSAAESVIAVLRCAGQGHSHSLMEKVVSEEGLEGGEGVSFLAQRRMSIPGQGDGK